MHPSAVASNTQTGGRAQSPGYVLLLASIAAISGFLFGFDTAVINGVLFFLRLQFHLSAFQTETAASSLLLGCLLGAASASLIGDRAGRKKSLIFAALLFAISSVGTALANSIVLFCVGRLIGGVAIGLASVLTPVYIAEIAPARNRGTLVAMNQLAIVVGILCAYLVSWKMAVLGDNSWRWMLGVAAIPSLAFFFGLLGIPESPRWLISHNKRGEGEAVLARIFGAAEAKAEVLLVEQAAAQEDGSWKEVFATPMHRPLGIAITLAVLCQVTGINTVLYYGSIIISEHFRGQSAGSALAANVIIGSTNLICTLIAMVFLDRWGRRTMLLTATAGMTLALTTMVCALHMNNVSPLIVLGSVIFYTGFFAFGMGPVPWIIISEIFPNKIRGRAASIATSTLWTGTLVVTFTFLSLVRRFDISGTFAIYAVLSLVSFMYIWRRVPETRGKTLEQIQQVWQKKEMNRG
jgi:SP family arabinose:H+ symporter-like MFS transporter